MARTHARVRGKSGSTRPVEADLSFVTFKAKEVEELIVKFHKEDDLTASLIGLKLRDNYGIPSVKKLTGKSITTILREHKQESSIPEDLQALVTKAKKLKKHLESNTRDKHNKRGLQLIEAKLRRLAKYYKTKGRLELAWRYD